MTFYSIWNAISESETRFDVDFHVFGIRFSSDVSMQILFPFVGFIVVDFGMAEDTDSSGC